MYWDYFMNNIIVYPKVEETLEALKEAKMKLAVVSDGSLSLRIRKLKRSGLLKFLDEVVASEEVIFEKPFSAIFTLALARLNVQAKDAVMIGNDYKNDARGAQLVGIRAGIFAPKENGNVLKHVQDGTEPDFIFHTYPELLKIFEVKE
jgi:putative hydrolase of the HAD superfamily